MLLGAAGSPAEPSAARVGCHASRTASSARSRDPARALLLALPLFSRSPLGVRSSCQSDLCAPFRPFHCFQMLLRSSARLGARLAAPVARRVAVASPAMRHRPMLSLCTIGRTSTIAVLSLYLLLGARHRRAQPPLAFWQRHQRTDGKLWRLRRQPVLVVNVASR